MREMRGRVSAEDYPFIRTVRGCCKTRSCLCEVHTGRGVLQHPSVFPANVVFAPLTPELEFLNGFFQVICAFEQFISRHGRLFRGGGIGLDDI